MFPHLDPNTSRNQTGFRKKETLVKYYGECPDQHSPAVFKKPTHRKYFPTWIQIHPEIRDLLKFKKETRAVGEYADTPLTCCLQKIRITKKKFPHLDLIASRNEEGFRKKETPAKWETPLFSKIRITKKKRPRLDLIASRNEGGFPKKETLAKWGTS